MKKQLLFITFFMCAIIAKAQTEFITTWKTDNPGTSSATSITIPTFPGETYNYDVDWNNDGNYDIQDIGYTGSITHDFGVPGTYTIRIRGVFPSILFLDGFTSTGGFNGGDKDKIISIDQWGNIAWTTFSNAFEGCVNLQVNATDSPNLTNITSLFYTFKGCTLLDQNFGSWNVQNVTDFTAMFDGVTLSNSNYDALLTGWNAQNLQPNVNFSGGNSQYCSQAAADARANMIASDGWIITDGGVCSTLSMEDLEINNNMYIYPNPSSNVFQINGLTENASVVIVDVAGKQVYSNPNYNTEEIITIDDLQSGLYVVQIKNGKARTSLKLIKD